MSSKIIKALIILLLAFSFLPGICVNNQFEVISKLFVCSWRLFVDLGTICAGIGTIYAVIVAQNALNNWTKQLKGESSLNRLLKNKENISILCCEFLNRASSITDSREREELYNFVKKTDYNFCILSRQINPNHEILEMKELLFMPKIRIRDHALLWENEKEKLKLLESKLNEYLRTFNPNQ